ncbi:hypothetical protein D3C76_1036400 [compost metagenome]
MAGCWALACAIRASTLAMNSPSCPAGSFMALSVSGAEGDSPRALARAPWAAAYSPSASTRSSCAWSWVAWACRRSVCSPAPAWYLAVAALRLLAARDSALRLASSNAALAWTW